MQNKNILDFNINWNYKSISLLIFLLIIPNLLGAINLTLFSTVKIHFFQIAIFLAAFIYGPKGGALAGLTGSIFSAYLMSNPYLIIGNIILGFFAGLFFKKKLSAITAVLIAFAIQLLWLILTDYYLIHLPIKIITSIIIALLISNILWAFIASKTTKHLKWIST